MAIVKNNSDSEIITKEDYKSTFSRFIKLLKSFLSSKDEKLNDFFVSKSTDSKEKEIIMDGCVDIDNYYEEMNQLHITDKSSTDYLVERLRQIEKEDGIDLSENEIKSILDESLDTLAQKESEHIYDVN